MYITYTMPDKKISQFDTFTGLTGEDVFFIVSSGESSNSNAQNYKIPFDDLKSDLGLDAGGGGAVIGGDTSNINFGGTTPGDNREINFQQGGENVMVIDQAGDINIENDLRVSGNVSGDVISGDAGAFGSLDVSGGLIASGGISGDVISGDAGAFGSLDVSGGLIASGGISGDVISGDAGAFGSLDVSGGLIASGGISGDVISGKTGIFSDYLFSPTGYFEEVIVSGDAYISGDFYVSGTTYVNEVIDTTISGTLSGYTGIFNMTSGENASFTNSLTISGVPVSTGAGGTVGGLPVVGGDNDNIDFGGTEPGDNREINFQQGGENVMVIDQAGDVNIDNDLYVSGNISGDIISGKTGVFTESLTISGVPVSTGAGGTVGGLPVVGGDNDNIDFGGTEPGDNREINFQQGGENVMVIDQAGDINIQNDLHVSGNISGDIISGKTGVFTESLTISGATVLTGNQQASIQWLEDAGGGQLTIRESSFDGVNFVISKWYSSTTSAGDIYYNDGQVGIGTNNPQFDLDVDGSANISDVLYVGGVRISGDGNGNLIFG